MRFETSVVLFALGALTKAAVSDTRHLMTPAHPPQFMQLDTVNHEICTRAVDRLLYQNFDPKIALRDHSKDNRWNDHSFSFPSALYWEDMRVKDPRDSQEVYATYIAKWLRISDEFDSSYSMWGSSDIELSDPNQGALGDCWIVAAASCVAQTPDRIRKLFVTDELNDAGVYAVTLYMMGIPVTVTVDDYLPFEEDWTNYPDITKSLTYARPSADGALWMPILEKAAAKLYGNYEMLIGGNMGPAIQTLTGAPYFNLYHNETSAEELWDWITVKINGGWMVTAGTPRGSEDSDKQTNDIGVAYMHAYTMLGINTLSNGQRLIRMRNPWGSEKFHGDWSDKSSKWTDQYRAEVDYLNDDDGIWFISLEDFHQSFSSTTANPNVDNYHHAHYAAFEVETPQISKPDDADYDPEKNMHIEDITITSPVDQMVYLSAYTYETQFTRNGACYDFDMIWDHVRLQFKVPGKTHSLRFSNYAHADGVQMKAGESFDVQFQAYWPPEDHSPHDYAIVSWSEHEPVTLISTHNHHSIDFPVFTLDGDVITDPVDPVVPDDPVVPVDPVVPDDPTDPDVPTTPPIKSCTGDSCEHSYPYDNAGSQFGVTMSATGSNSMHFDFNVDYDSYMPEDHYEPSFDLIFNDRDNIELVWSCDYGETKTWTKHDSFEAYGWKWCESQSRPYFVEFVTSTGRPKAFTDLLNEGDMQLIFSFYSGLTYTVGWNLDESSVKSELKKDSETYGGEEWSWESSQFNPESTDGSDEDSGDDADSSVRLVDNSTENLEAVHDIKILSGSEMLWHDVVIVEDAQSFTQKFTSDLDSLDLTFEINWDGVNWDQKIKWDGVLDQHIQETVTFEDGSAVKDISSNDSDFGWALSSSIDTEHGIWSVYLYGLSYPYTYISDFNLRSGESSWSIEKDYRKIFEGDWSMTGSAWNVSEDSYLSLKLETASDENHTAKTHVSTGVYAGVSIAAVSLLAVVCASKRKSVTPDDSFERAI